MKGMGGWCPHPNQQGADPAQGNSGVGPSGSQRAGSEAPIAPIAGTAGPAASAGSGQGGGQGQAQPARAAVPVPVAVAAGATTATPATAAVAVSVPEPAAAAKARAAERRAAARARAKARESVRAARLDAARRAHQQRADRWLTPVAGPSPEVTAAPDRTAGTADPAPLDVVLLTLLAAFAAAGAVRLRRGPAVMAATAGPDLDAQIEAELQELLAEEHAQRLLASSEAALRD